MLKRQSPSGLTALPAGLLHLGPCLDRVVAEQLPNDRLPAAPFLGCHQRQAHGQQRATHNQPEEAA